MFTPTGFSFDRVVRAARRAANGLWLIGILYSGATLGVTFTGTLTGPAESPPNASPGTGTTVVTYNAASHLLTVDVTFSGLQAGTTASHIHCCTATPNTSTAGVATQVPSFVGFPLGVTAGSFSNSFDLTLAANWNPAFITANGGTPATAEAALAAGLLSNRAYLNIHSTLYPGGEIRAFLTPLAAPTFTKSFSPTTITTGGASTLTFTLTNPASNPLALTGVAFTDNLPAGLGVATGLSSVCGGTLTTTSSSIALTGATIAVNGQCQFSVPLLDVTVGTFTNTTGAVTSTNGVTGTAASATLTVLTAPLIPTLSPWLMAVLGGMLLLGAWVYLRKRRA
jgi:hypothetical protein